MSTQLQALLQQQALDRQIAEMTRASLADAIGRIRTLMAEHGLAAGTRAKGAAKYRHPATGVIWSGRGLKPK